MANAPKTASQTTTRNFWTGLSWFRYARMSSSNWRNKIFRIIPYWMKLLSFARLSNIGSTTNFPPFDWGSNLPKDFRHILGVEPQLLAVLLPSRGFSASFDRYLDLSKPALGTSSSVVSVYRSYHLLYVLFKES